MGYLKPSFSGDGWLALPVMVFFELVYEKPGILLSLGSQGA